jgi:hypothetical protein
VLNLSKLQPYSLALEEAVKACQGPTLKLITKIRKLRYRKCFITLDLGRKYGSRGHYSYHVIFITAHNGPNKLECCIKHGWKG